jgi:hypothetical protein
MAPLKLKTWHVSWVYSRLVGEPGEPPRSVSAAGLLWRTSAGLQATGGLGYNNNLFDAVGGVIGGPAPKGERPTQLP